MQHTGKLDSIDYMITAVSCCKTLCPSIYAGLTSTTWNILADQTYRQCLPPSVSPRLKPESPGPSLVERPITTRIHVSNPRIVVPHTRRHWGTYTIVRDVVLILWLTGLCPRQKRADNTEILNVSSTKCTNSVFLQLVQSCNKWFLIANTALYAAQLHTFPWYLLSTLRNCWGVSLVSVWMWCSHHTDVLGVKCCSSL